MPCTRESKEEIGKNEMCAGITSTLDGKGGRVVLGLSQQAIVRA